jgi:hypothetical protein
VDHTEVRRQLERALDAFDATVTERGWDQPPLLLRLEASRSGCGKLELGMRALDRHPATELLGFSAPLSWRAVGVSAEGWATSFPDLAPQGHRGKPTSASPRSRVRTLVLLGCGGELVGRARCEDGRQLAEPPTEGLVVDCLRRALGRPTPPPTATTNVLFASMWLENVLAPSHRWPNQLTWRETVALHPALRLLAREGRGAKVDDVEEAVGALGKVCDWSMVRQQVIHDWKAGLDPSLAAWMDTGMVSRWLLDRRPGVDELFNQLANICPTSMLQRIHRFLLDLRVIRSAEESDVA